MVLAASHGLDIKAFDAVALLAVVDRNAFALVKLVPKANHVAAWWRRFGCRLVLFLSIAINARAKDKGDKGRQTDGNNTAPNSGN
jgi:hypothetical protein